MPAEDLLPEVLHYLAAVMEQAIICNGNQKAAVCRRNLVTLVEISYEQF